MKSTIPGNWVRVSLASLALVVTLAAVPAAFGRVSPALSERTVPLRKASNAQSQGRYGPLDPWAYRLVHAAAPTLITEHSAGQDPDRRPILVLGNAPATIHTSAFQWSDAGIGAAAALGLVFALVAATVLRKRRTLAGASV
jgi:hypothetical protein